MPLCQSPPRTQPERRMESSCGKRHNGQCSLFEGHQRPRPRVRDDNCVPKYRTLRAWSPTGCSFPVGVMCNRLKCLEPEMVLYSDCKAGEGERQGRDKIKGGGKENEKREPYLLSSGNNTSISNGDDCNRQTFLCCRSRGGVKKVESVWRQENLSLSSLSRLSYGLTILD
jgi:hypothetical protein